MPSRGSQFVLSVFRPVARRPNRYAHVMVSQQYAVVSDDRPATIDPIGRRTDLEGCGCVRCQRVDGTLLRRSILGDFRESVSLLRRSPSLLVLAAALTVATGELWSLLESLPQTWPVDTPIAFFIAVLFIVVRPYVGTITLLALTDGDVSTRQAVWYSLRRIPAVAVTSVAVVVAMGVVLVAASMLVWALVAGIIQLHAGLGAVVERTVFDGPGATVLFGSIMTLAGYKLWLAADICVVGGYGPLCALRMSWAITAMHRWRVVIVVFGFLLTAFGPRLAAMVVGAAGGEFVLEADLGFLVGLSQAVASMVVFSAGGQLYARAALE